MFGPRFCALVQVLLLISIPTGAQQIPSTSINGRPSAPKDSHAISIVNQALAAGGGASAFEAIVDYTATGTMTYHRPQDISNPITLRALGLKEFRIDSNLPNNVVSQSIASDGRTVTKNQNGTVTWDPPQAQTPGQTIKPLPYGILPYRPPMFPGGFASPYQELAIALTRFGIGIFYKGMVNVDGISAYDIQIGVSIAGRSGPLNPYYSRDFFIDSSSLQILMTRDIIPPRSMTHEIHYSNYTNVHGVLVPFLISERVAGQKLRDIQLSMVTFNSGLTDEIFTLQ